MKKKFDLYEALKAEGFEETEGMFGQPILTKKIEKEIDVVWHGKQISSMTIEINFNPEKTVLRACYYDGLKRPFKEKVHLNDKRAYNAIHLTAELKGYAF